MIRVERKITEKSKRAINSLKIEKSKNVLRRTLRKELAHFKEFVREYKEAEDEEREDLEYLLRQQLQDSSPFAAFKRWLIRDNKEAYPELLEYIS